MQCSCCRFIAQRQNAATAAANANWFARLWPAVEPECKTLPPTCLIACRCQHVAAARLLAFVASSIELWTWPSSQWFTDFLLLPIAPAGDSCNLQPATCNGSSNKSNCCSCHSCGMCTFMCVCLVGLMSLCLLTAHEPLFGLAPVRIRNMCADLCLTNVACNLCPISRCRCHHTVALHIAIRTQLPLPFLEMSSQQNFIFSLPYGIEQN